MDGIMTDSVYEVRLHREHVGALHRRDSFTTFTFDKYYWARRDRMVLGRWFEDHPRKQPRATNQVPSWFSNLLPEGRLRLLIAHEQGVSIHREMDLLARIGADLPGAVSVAVDAEESVDLDPTEAVQLEPQTRGLTPPREALRFSLAGMALKFSLRQTGDRLAIPAHGQDGDWILKTPDRQYPGLPENEFAMMELARRTGLAVPETALWARERLDDLGPGAWPSDETAAYAVRRFDRSSEGRIHIEDFAQVLGRAGAGEGKYRSNVETVVGLAFRGQDVESLQEAVRRCALNLLIGNGDAHLKNWSLIYPDGKRARLSPAYDLVCTAVCPGQAELGLPFFGARHIAEVHREHFVKLQAALGVGRSDVLGVLDEVLDAFSQTWQDVPVPEDVGRWIGEHRDGTLVRLSRET